MSALVVRGDAAHLPLPDASVDLIVTSPPYYGLRSYTDGGEHYAGQIGSEAAPAEYIAALVACTAEWVRVLKPEGSLFVNLGDKYSQRTINRRSSHQPGIFPDKFPEFAETWAERAAKGETRMPHQNVIADDGRYIPEKSLMGLPWRYALAAVDQLGLILRAEIVWAKPNGLPESVTDRVRRAHEQVFHLVKQPRYYAAVDEIREPQAAAARPELGLPNTSGNGVTHRSFNRNAAVNPLGKLPGSVWSIPSQPLTVPASLGVDHFAAFPMELPRRLILGWSPPGICQTCGEGFRPIVVSERVKSPKHADGSIIGSRRGQVRGWDGLPQFNMARACIGFECRCGRPTGRAKPAVVLDPFGGTGTTALVADAYGRTGITVDRSADYSRLAAWRTSDPGERARALEVDKPPAVIDGQETLFAL